MIRIIIADDQLLFRSMLEEMLKRDDQVEIIASCATGEEALESCQKHAPDVVLLDIGMPGKGGIETLKDIKAMLPKTKVAMLTTFEDGDSIKSAVLLGADGYLIKELMPDDLILAVKSIHHDMVLFHSSVYRVLQSALDLAQQPREKKCEIGDLIFDAVEISIMKLIAVGKSNKDIASALNYSEGTIKNKVSKILAATGLSDRTELTVFAINNQII